jgi:site-specific DNA-methyltransferase (adenine-specific)
LAERLVKMFSFAGDVVLDPFVGTGTTSLAALNAGRNSIGVDIENKYLAQAHARLLDAAGLFRESGPSHARIIFNGNP